MSSPSSQNHIDEARGRPLVLVVDDHQDTREIFAELLGDNGFRVAEATNGQEAVELGLSLQPDLIVMDLSLPVMDGWEATRALKGDERTRAIPVVALSGYSQASHSEEARQVGCDSFVSKPCLPDALLDELWRLLDRSPPPPEAGARRGF